jgi:hypothetical protein
MAAPFVTIPTAGADLNSITTAADAAAGKVLDARLGTIQHTSNGKFAVYAKANATITASTAVCTVNATTFLATATGGSYTSPAVAMASGDYGWFTKASV